LTKPSKDSIKKITETLKTVICQHRGKTQTELIKSLNPIITGWANYHKHACAKKTFAKIDTFIFRALWKWAKRRHPNKSRKWIKNRYWKRTLFNNWLFSDGRTILKRAAHTKIVRHRIIKFDANPYLPEFRSYYYYRDKQRMLGRNHDVAANGIFGE